MRWAERDEASRHGVLAFHPAVWAWVVFCMLVRVALFTGALIVGSLLIGGGIGLLPEGSWWALVGLTIVGYVGIQLWEVYRRIFDGQQRQQDWHDRVVEEYFSWRIPPVVYWPANRQKRGEGELRSELRRWSHKLRRKLLHSGPMQRMQWIRTPLHRWILSRVQEPQHNASHEDRLAWARSWARTQEIRHLPGYVALVGFGFVSLTLALARLGMIDVNESEVGAHVTTLMWGNDQVVSRSTPLLFGTGTGFGTALDYLWQIVDMIPFLGATDVFWWDRPRIFSGDPVQGALVLLFRALMFAPALAYIAFLFRSQDEVVIDRYPPAGPAEAAVVAALLSRQLPDLDLGDWDEHDDVLMDAAMALNRNGPPPPPPAVHWDLATVARVLMVEQASVRRNPPAAPGRDGGQRAH